MLCNCVCQYLPALLCRLYWFRSCEYDKANMYNKLLDCIRLWNIWNVIRLIQIQECLSTHSFTYWMTISYIHTHTRKHIHTHFPFGFFRLVDIKNALKIYTLRLSYIKKWAISCCFQLVDELCVFVCISDLFMSRVTFYMVERQWNRKYADIIFIGVHFEYLHIKSYFYREIFLWMFV